MMTRCPYCNGSGERLKSNEEDDTYVDCSACQGAGFVPRNWLDEPDD